MGERQESILLYDQIVRVWEVVRGGKGVDVMGGGESVGCEFKQNSVNICALKHIIVRSEPCCA